MESSKNLMLFQPDRVKIQYIPNQQKSSSLLLGIEDMPL